MQAKRALMGVFAALSLLFVLDVVRPASGPFGGIFDDPIFKYEWTGGSAVPADFEEVRALEPFSILQGEKVWVEGTLGDLRVIETESGEATASYAIRIWGSGDAATFARRVSLSWRRENGRAVLAFESPQALPRGLSAVSVDVELAVPKGTNVFVDHRGNLAVEGLSGDLEIEHFGGEVTVRNVQGAVTAATRYGLILVEGAGGPVSVSHFAGEAVVRDTAGPVTGEMRFGDMVVERPGGFVTLDVSLGTASVEELRGGADLKLRYGELDVFLAPGGGWNVKAVAELGEIETDFNLVRTGDGSRTEVSGIIGDGREPLAIAVSQGVAKLVGVR